MTIDLGGQRVLVVGATGGIGQATSKAFTEVGASVTVAGRDQGKFDRLATELNGDAALLDTTDNEGIERFFATAEPFDHVVMAATRTKRGPVGELPRADAVAAMDNKFWGTYRIARRQDQRRGIDDLRNRHLRCHSGVSMMPGDTLFTRNDQRDSRSARIDQGRDRSYRRTFKSEAARQSTGIAREEPERQLREHRDQVARRSYRSGRERRAGHSAPCGQPPSSPAR